MTFTGLPSLPSSPPQSKRIWLNYAGLKLDPEDTAYPTLCLVTHDNSQPNATPVSTGYLYRKDNRFYLSGPTHDAPEFLFEFDPGLSAAGKNADWYLPAIAPDGSVILVWRGNYVFEKGGSSADARHDPIVYPAGDFSNPVVVNITGKDKPTAPTKHVGFEFDPVTGAMVMVEYTRNIHARGHIWRVTAPYTRPEDWSIVHTESVDENDLTTGKIEHWHGVQRDPWSGQWFATTGDLGKQRKLFTSPDGITWTLTRDDHNALRMINAIPRADGIWWGTDNVRLDEENWVYFVPRDANGAPDWSDLQPRHQLLSGQAVYSTHYLTQPEGLLFLSRVERWPQYGDSVAMQFYSFERDEVLVLDRLKPLPTLSIAAVGYRCEGIRVYPGADPTAPVLAGFGGYANEMQMLDNNADNPINTLEIHVREAGMSNAPIFLTGLPQKRRRPTPDDPSGFTPKHIADLALWLDASDLTTFAESGGAISRWDDKSGRQHHASQPVLNRRPALVLDAVNGLPAVRFDGINDRLEILSPSGLDIARNAAGLTAIAVVNSTADGVTQRIFQANIAGSTGNAPRFALYKSGSSNQAGIVVRQSDAGSTSFTTTSALGATHAILTGVADFAGGSIRVLLNGQNPATAAVSVGSTDDTASEYVWVGGGGVPAGPHLTGDIAEVIVYRQALSDEDRERVEAYLADKWGITLA